ncbi:MAG: energy transducer TonB [Betaproteobacteria bacterium]|nr:energy transducer TonB [Betaproteobacteria bacterium]
MSPAPATLRTVQGLLPTLAASALLHAVALAALAAWVNDWRSQANSLERQPRARLNAVLAAAQSADAPQTGGPAGRTDSDSLPDDGAQAGARLEWGAHRLRAPPRPEPDSRRRLAPAEAANYLPARDLDRNPQIRVHVEPQFPPLALAPSGRVVLRLYVSETGTVDDIAVEYADSTGAFDVAARQAFSTARFYPGVKNGRPVKSLLRIEVQFGAPSPRAAPDQAESPGVR